MGAPPKGGVDRAQASHAPQTPKGPDASDHRKAVKPMIGRHEHFTQFASSLPFMVWTATPEGAIDYFNDIAVIYAGVPPESLLGDGWSNFVHPDDVPEIARLWERSLATGEPFSIDYRMRHHDGEYRWHWVQAKTELEDDGSLLRWWGTAIDIHEIRMLQAQAAILAEDREAILESIGDGVCTLDSDFRFTYCNSHVLALLPLPREAILGHVVWKVIPDIQDSDTIAMFHRVLETKQPERKQYYSDLHKAWFDVSVNPFSDGLTLHVRDITQMKSLSEQLAIAHRLEAIGQLTGGIAHDFNNLLTVVMGAIESLSMEQSLSPAGKEMIDLVSQAATRGADLTHRLLAFARQQPLAPQAICIGEYVGSFIPLLKSTLGDEIEIVANIDSGLPLTLIDPGQLENALLNLGINARDAMPEGGILEIETGVTDLDEEYAATHGDVKPGKYVIISVGDTGTGIAPEHLSRLFDPFFTTKPVGQGSGLGLPMVWGFAKQSGGHIAVYSELGRGTTIRLYLPVAPEGMELEEARPSQAHASIRGTGHVLLVEDDELVRKYSADQLAGHGYTVTAAGSGPEALDVLDTLGKIDLLFTDVILPGGMTGRQLAVKVVALRPDTPVLYASGYTESVLMHDGRLDPGVSLLEKPYTSRQLLERVHQLISAPSTESARP